jgi:hypothetical protein
MRHIVSYRLTPAQWDALRREAANAEMDLNDYARAKAVSGAVTVIEARRFPFDLVYELRRIGNNLNQQTVIAHVSGELPPELKQVWADLQKILDLILEDQ